MFGAVAQAQVEAPAAPESVRPGINKKYLEKDLKVDDWKKRFEVESREVFSERAEVMKACGLKPGMQVADVGVYAVDIVPGFLEYINEASREIGLKNVTTVLCPHDSVALPSESVDFVFLCDTYHHLEYPKPVMASVMRAMKKGAVLFVLDFEKVPGKSRKWLLDHVRANKQEVKKEISDVGFTFKDEVKIEGLKENYVLRFVKE
jgi:predicted methyltransferase